MLNLPRVSFESFRFAEPLYLWLLIVPAVLFAVWIWRFVRRRGDLKRLRARRALPRALETRLPVPRARAGH